MLHFSICRGHIYRFVSLHNQRKMTGRKVLISMMVLSLIPTTHGFYSNNTVDIEESTGSQDLGKYPRSKYRPSLYFMNEHCEKTILLFSRNSIRISPWNDKYPPKSTSCRMGIKYAKYPAYYLSLTFHSIDMSRKIAGECETSRLDLYDGVVSSSSRRRISESVGICGKKAFKESYTTSGSFLTMIYTTHRLPHSYQNFVAVITPYHYGKCAGDEFKCANSRCIKNNNLCNSYDNCGDGSDEKSCAVLALSIAAIIGIAVGAAILIAIIVTIICCCCCCASCGYERF